MCSPQSNGFFIASSVNTWTLLQTASRVLELAHSLKAAWMVVASNPSTEPDRPSPGLLTICKYRLMLCSGQRCTETLTVCPASELWNLFLFSLFISVQPSTVCKFNTCFLSNTSMFSLTETKALFPRLRWALNVSWFKCFEWWRRIQNQYVMSADSGFDWYQQTTVSLSTRTWRDSGTSLMFKSFIHSMFGHVTLNKSTDFSGFCHF